MLARTGRHAYDIVPLQPSGAPPQEIVRNDHALITAKLEGRLNYRSVLRQEADVCPLVHGHRSKSVCGYCDVDRFAQNEEPDQRFKSGFAAGAPQHYRRLTLTNLFRLSTPRT
jgi:hypothetical protein